MKDEKNIPDFYHHCLLGITLTYLREASMVSTDEKLDELIRCVADLKQSHNQSQKDLDGKLKKLECRRT